MNVKCNTICAIVTPAGSGGGVGIVRVSGKEAVEVLQKIWKGKSAVSDFESHKMMLGHVVDPKQGDPVDNVLAVIMRAPHSYTGEDVVEISCHGGPLILKRLIQVCVHAGARLAEPGEFTKRAFLNNKMDLTQAEAVADLIAATNEKASCMALDQLDGSLSKQIHTFMDRLTEVRALVEATIDFPEEDIEYIKNDHVKERLQSIAQDLTQLNNTYDEGRLIKDGISVAILGAPNVGKSSLFNQLVGRDRAIIHHEPGTTRDLITETVVWQGLSFHLTDAAGIRDQAGDVETIGIDRAKALLGRADLVVYVKDATCLEESDMKGLNPKQTILCINKIDQFSLSSSGALSLSSSGLTGGSSFLENNKKWLACVQTSATQEIGINDLKEMIVVNALKERSVRSDQEGVIITSARHKAALDQTITSLKQSIHEVNQKQSAEFIALHLNQASDALGHIIGVVTSDDILNQIFSRFCIGK